uniref:Uncharacterized protein n=1 Tax=Arundo donax TaxID=35708 RepID=A0A0A9AE15_ARUDO
MNARNAPTCFPVAKEVLLNNKKIHDSDALQRL